MADVFILPSPTPTLYVYPSALHPTAPTTTSGVGFPFAYTYPTQSPDDDKRRRRDETALAVLGAL